MSGIDLRRRAVFDTYPERYARARPGYPDEVFDLILSYAGVRAGARALEVGCGPGQATIPMAKRGLRIVAVELGERLARYAATRTAGMDVWVEPGAFEDWPLPAEPFDLLYSASAFHWISPACRYVKAAKALRPGGTLALFWNRQVRDAGPDSFDEALQEIYKAEAPDLGRHLGIGPSAGVHHADWLAEIAASGLFEDPTGRVVPWSNELTTDEYISLLSTYSDHATLPVARRERLLGAIRSLIDQRCGGRLHRRWATVLYLGRRT